MGPLTPISHCVPVVLDWRWGSPGLRLWWVGQVWTTQETVSGGQLWASLRSSSQEGWEDKWTREEMHLICICGPDWKQANTNDAPIQIPKPAEAGTFQAFRLADCRSYYPPRSRQENRSLTDSEMMWPLSLWSWVSPARPDVGREPPHSCCAFWEMSRYGQHSTIPRLAWEPTINLLSERGHSLHLLPWNHLKWGLSKGG